jgi:hypothetical protein
MGRGLLSQCQLDDRHALIVTYHLARKAQESPAKQLRGHVLDAVVVKAGGLGVTAAVVLGAALYFNDETRFFPDEVVAPLASGMKMNFSREAFDSGFLEVGFEDTFEKRARVLYP